LTGLVKGYVLAAQSSFGPLGLTTRSRGATCAVCLGAWSRPRNHTVVRRPRAPRLVSDV